MKKLLAIFIVLAMVFAFTAEAMADASLYGSARFRTYRTDQDEDAGDDQDTEWKMGYLTRFGVNFSMGDITGKFELDARDKDGLDGASTVGDMRLRHLWGEWNFGSGKFMIGQNFPLYDAPISGIAYFSGGLQKFGGIGYAIARTSQIRLTFGNLKIAFLSPDVSHGGPLQADTTTSTTFVAGQGLVTTTSFTGDFSEAYGSDVDTNLPKIELRYTLKLDPVALDFIGGWQEYEAVDGSDDSVDITSWVTAIRAKANFGAAYINAQVSYTENGRNYGVWSVVEDYAYYDGDDVVDSNTLGYGIALGYKVSDQLKVEVSYMKADADMDVDSGDYSDEAQAYGILLQYKPVPSVVIQPEIIVDDREDIVFDGDSTPEGKTTIFGVWWMINFK